MVQVPFSFIANIAFTSYAMYHHGMTATLELPSPEAAREAKVALRVLSPLAATTRPTQRVRVRPEGASAEQSVTVPREAFALFLEVLGQMANGNAVTIVPVHAELTTQQAADYLNVSRPYVVQLLESGKLPFRKVGKHRRVLFEDLATFKRREEERRKQVMQELADEAQRHGLGYQAAPRTFAPRPRRHPDQAAHATHGVAMTLLESLRSRKAEIVAAAQRHGARQIRLFGSAARGEERPDSDVDFVVDLEPGRSLLDLGGLLADLEGLLGRKVDVVTEAGLRPRVRQSALKGAVAL